MYVQVGTKRNKLRWTLSDCGNSSRNDWLLVIHELQWTKPHYCIVIPKNQPTLVDLHELCVFYLRRWELRETAISDTEEHYMSGGGALLVIPRTSVSDTGRYSCTAVNSAGSLRLDIHLQVQAPLSAHLTPTLLTATLGQPASFHCSKSGHYFHSLLSLYTILVCFFNFIDTKSLL